MNVVVASIAVLALSIPAAASARPGNGHGAENGAHANGHDGQDAQRGHNGQTRGKAAMANGSWTPPGLAKKPHGMPPGQAKKSWNQGERLPDQYYTQSRYYVADPAVAHLAPAPEGSRWVKVGDNYYLAQTRTGVVSQIISALTR